jgi:hypothetical protein
MTQIRGPRLSGFRQEIEKEELACLIEGRSSAGSAKDELVKLATRPIVKEALEPHEAERESSGQSHVMPAKTACGIRLPPRPWSSGYRGDRRR